MRFSGYCYHEKEVSTSINNAGTSCSVQEYKLADMPTHYKWYFDNLLYN